MDAADVGAAIADAAGLQLRADLREHPLDLDVVSAGRALGSPVLHQESHGLADEEEQHDDQEDAADQLLHGRPLNRRRATSAMQATSTTIADPATVWATTRG